MKQEEIAAGVAASAGPAPGRKKLAGMGVASDNGGMCPVFRPSREEFEQPFCDYVRKIFKKHPDLPMFKVGLGVGLCRGLRFSARFGPVPNQS